MRTRQAINFDLDVNNLKIHYKNNSYTNAYDDIKRFLLSNGFEHRQGSGYVSIKPINRIDTMDVIRSLSHKYDWFPKCVNKCDVTSVGREYDALDYLGITKGLGYESENSEKFLEQNLDSKTERLYDFEEEFDREEVEIEDEGFS